MPDQERAKLLALVLGGVIVGMLYALGGLSLYLKAGYLTPAPTQLEITRLGVEPSEVPNDAARSPGSGLPVTLAPERGGLAQATLYPTLTPDLTRTAMAAMPLAAPATVHSMTATPFPTPTGAEESPPPGAR